MIESLIAFGRAGADAVLTYFAPRDAGSRQGRTRPTLEGGTKRGPKCLKTLGRAGKMAVRASEASSPLSRDGLRAPLPPPNAGTL